MELDNLQTTDHGTIREWATSRDGTPIQDPSIEDYGGLQILFPEETLHGKEISWEQFFHTFDEHNLLFIYQEKAHNDQPSTDYTFADRDDTQ